MLIDPEKLTHWIENFYGYGSWKSPIWFVSYEEGGGELPEEVADKINYFSSVYPNDEKVLCDVRALYGAVSIQMDGPRAALYKTRYDFRFGKDAVLHGVWKNLIAFSHGYRNEALPDLLSYQRIDFATASLEREALLVLYPLPSPHNHAWYYSWLQLPGLEYIRNRAVYQQTVYEERINTILTNLASYQPEVVLMYGMENINGLKKSVQEFFEGVQFKAVKGVKLETPQHHWANVNGTRLIITTQIPALRHNRAETAFDWGKMGARMAR